jgi:hypothetical protein
MLAVVVVSLLQGLAYEDIHQRFTIDLPNEWQLAPMPGDTGGVTFRRVRESALALCTVRISELKKMTLDVYVKRWIEGISQLPGYKAIESQPDKVAGAPAQRVKYSLSVDKEGKLRKTVEDRITLIGGVGYMIHTESLDQSYDSFNADFAHFIETFKPAGQDAKQANQQTVGNLAVVGIWRMQDDKNTVLTLNPNGTMTMAAYTGLYRLDGPRLVMQLTGGTQEIFTWNVVGDTLTLVSPQLGEAIKYNRQR